MNDIRRHVVTAVALAATFPVVAQPASAPGGASGPIVGGGDGRIIDPTFFVALVVALVVGIFIGRLTVKQRAMG